MRRLITIHFMWKPWRPLEIGSSKTSCADGVLFVRSSLTMSLCLSKCSPTLKNTTTSDTFGYQDITLGPMALQNVHTLMSDKCYSRHAMETNQSGIQWSPPSCGPTESQSTDVWAVPHTSQPLGCTLFCPLILLKQHTFFFCPMPLYPQLPSLLSALSPC